MTQANDRQVGGAHYKGKFQHWDWVAINHLDYYTACATKYLTRWPQKGGLQDIEKSIHFCEKLYEVTNSGILVLGVKRLIRTNDFLADAGLLDTKEANIITSIAACQAPDELQSIIGTLHMFYEYQATAWTPPKPMPQPLPVSPVAEFMWSMDVREILSYKRFSFEGSKSGTDEYRCKMCKTTILVPTSQAPVGHQCEGQ